MKKLEDYVRTIVGNNGNRYPAELLIEVRRNLANIDNLVIKALSNSHLFGLLLPDDIKKYADSVEKRLNDEWCTLENVLSENAKTFERAMRYNADYLLIDEKYEIDIKL